MSPEIFISRHIIAQLVAEGFPEQVAADAANIGLDHYRRMSQASRKGGLLMTAASVRVSGQQVRLRQRNGRQRKSRESVVEGTFPACSDFAQQYLLSEQTFKETFHEKTYQ